VKEGGKTLLDQTMVLFGSIWRSGKFALEYEPADSYWRVAVLNTAAFAV